MRRRASVRENGLPDATATLSRWFTAAERLDDGPVVRYATRVLAEADPGSYALALESIASYVGPSPLPAQAIPVSVIAAELDAVSPPEVMRTMARRFPSSQFTVLSGAAHLSPFTDPDALARLLLNGASARG